MNKIIIYLICSFLAVSGTWVVNRFQLRKAVKPYKKQISVLRSDSAFTARKIQKMAKDSTARWKSDSLKSELIAQGQLVMQELAKQKRQLKKDSTAQAIVIKDLKSWIEDARDGVVTDTVEFNTNFWGRRKQIKKSQ